MKEVHWFTGILFAATGPVIPLYYDGYIDQKWSMTAIVVFVSIVYILLSRSTLRLDRRPLANASSLITVYLCSYTCLSYFLKGPVLTGPFENPNVLSLHLCLLLPLVHEGVRQTEGGKRIAHVILETVSVLTIIATGCRAGWICLLVCVFLAVLKGRWKLVVIPLVFSSGLFLASSVKLPSSQGRSFILRNTVELIGESPILGHGIGAFSREYMPRQAAYFKNHDNRDLEFLADDIHHPLNEFLLAGVNHGIVGVISLSLLLIVPLFWKRKLYIRHRPLWTSTCILVVFCMFSYPLQYPISWLLLFSVWAVVCQGKPGSLSRYFRPWVLAGSIICLLLTLGYTCLLLEWGYASRMSKRGHSAEMMCLYARLYPFLSWHGIFLYDYAIESLYADENEQALRLAGECRRHFVSYDLVLLEGDICQALGRYDNALAHYDMAAYMCPVRFAPLYGKWQVYKDTKRNQEMDSMANMILTKDIKVNSREIQLIINDVKQTKN